jgi:outer membrane lipoprotein-sorting protein
MMGQALRSRTLPKVRAMLAGLPPAGLGLFLAPSLWAQTAAFDPSEASERGLAIAREADRRAGGYEDYEARLTMVLRGRDGKEKSREMLVSVLAVEGDGDRTLIVFRSPRDLTGTALLTHGHTDESDDQWLYLPSLKRVKRIAAARQSGSFMGSEFAYEDIGSQEVRKFTYRYAGEETVNGTAAFVVDRIPTDQNSGYSRQRVWLDTEEYRPRRIEYYGRQDELLKTLTFADYRHHAGRYWRAGEMTMVNHRTGRSTALIWEDYTFDSGLGKRRFSPDGLARHGR